MKAWLEERDNEIGQVSQSQFICDLPRVLMFQINRLGFDDGGYKKKFDKFEFDRRIVVDEFMADERCINRLAILNNKIAELKEEAKSHSQDVENLEITKKVLIILDEIDRMENRELSKAENSFYTTISKKIPSSADLKNSLI